MIYLGFIFDYIISLFLPVNSYFVVNEIDDNNIFEIIVIGIILDTLYGKFFWNLIIILLLYGLCKIIKVKKKYLFIKNIIIYTLYFSIMNIFIGYNIALLSSFLIGLLLQIIYFYLSNILIKT